MENLTDIERNKMEYESQNASCTCGHLKKEHNRFIIDTCMFTGCFGKNCGCQKFTWPQNSGE
jgi:hypothetical protein